VGCRRFYFHEVRFDVASYEIVNEIEQLEYHIVRKKTDLAVQLAGHDMLKGLGIDLMPASAPDFFLENTATAVLVRQVLGAIAQFEKATVTGSVRTAVHRSEGR
jgi:hypothetical protein